MSDVSVRIRSDFFPTCAWLLWLRPISPPPSLTQGSSAVTQRRRRRSSKRNTGGTASLRRHRWVGGKG